jgi:hypothetical protein
MHWIKSFAMAANPLIRRGRFSKDGDRGLEAVEPQPRAAPGCGNNLAACEHLSCSRLVARVAKGEAFAAGNAGVINQRTV